MSYKGGKLKLTDSKGETSCTTNPPSRKIQHQTNYNYFTVNFNGRSTDIVPLPHRYPTTIKFIEAFNYIAIVTPYVLFYLIKLQMNAVIHPETLFAQ